MRRTLAHRRGRASRGALRCVAEHKTGVKRNTNLGKLQAGYLFPEVSGLSEPYES